MGVSVDSAPHQCRYHSSPTQVLLNCTSSLLTWVVMHLPCKVTHMPLSTYTLLHLAVSVCFLGVVAVSMVGAVSTVSAVCAGDASCTKWWQ